MRLLALLALSLAAGSARSAPPAPPDTFSVVTLNLWHDQSDWPRRMGRMLRELRVLQPDVLCLQEVLQHATLPNQALAVADSLGYSAHFTSVDDETRPKRYGNAILTRHPVMHTGARSLLPLDDYRTVAHVRIDFHGQAIDVYDTHLHHTHEGGAIRSIQIRDLIAFIDSTRGTGPLILAGDFNSALGSPEMKLLDHGYEDVYARLHPGASVAESATMNPLNESSPRAIDHILLGRRGRERWRPVHAEVLFRQADEQGVWVSDHFGVLARFAREPGRKAGGGRSAGH